MMISDEPARQAVHLREDEIPLLHEVALDRIVRQVLIRFGQPLSSLALDLAQRLGRAAWSRWGRHGGHRLAARRSNALLRKNVATQLFRHQITSGLVRTRRAAAQFPNEAR